MNAIRVPLGPWGGPGCIEGVEDWECTDRLSVGGSTGEEGGQELRLQGGGFEGKGASPLAPHYPVERLPQGSTSL